MKATLTLNKGHDSLTHNARTAKEKNQTWQNSLTGSNIWICDRCKSSADLRKMYSEIFDSSLKKYNQFQISKGHSERQIRDYYDKIRNSKQEHLTYSFVYQIGELDLIAKGSEEEQCCINALKDIANDFENRNSAFKVTQSVIHCDEKGIAHLHIIFIPVSTANKRGLETKNSFVGALRDMGYKGQENFKLWRSAEIQACEKIMMDRGIEKIQSRNHENLVHDMDIYKQMKADEEKIANISHKKTISGAFNNTVMLNITDYEKLIETAKKGVYLDAVKAQTAKDRRTMEKKFAKMEQNQTSSMNQLNNECNTLDNLKNKLSKEEERRIENLCGLLEELEKDGRGEEAGNLRWAIFKIETNV